MSKYSRLVRNFQAENPPKNMEEAIDFGVEMASGAAKCIAFMICACNEAGNERDRKFSEEVISAVMNTFRSMTVQYVNQTLGDKSPFHNQTINEKTFEEVMQMLTTGKEITR